MFLDEGPLEVLGSGPLRDPNILGGNVEPRVSASLQAGTQLPNPHASFLKSGALIQTPK